MAFERLALKYIQIDGLVIKFNSGTSAGPSSSVMFIIKIRNCTNILSIFAAKGVS